MRKILPEKLRAARYDGDPSWGAYGAFQLMGPCGESLRIVASAADPRDTLADGWEHVSVSTKRRVPNWTEMCFVKALFWEDEEAVLQFHPPKSDYVNNHPHCLHLWRHKDGHRLPPSILVGVSSLGPIEPGSRDEQQQVEALRQAAADLGAFGVHITKDGERIAPEELYEVKDETA